jgi:hypothetical protein
MKKNKKQKGKELPRSRIQHKNVATITNHHRKGICQRNSFNLFSHVWICGEHRPVCPAAVFNTVPVFDARHL